MKTIKFLFPAMFIAFVMAACNGPRKDSTEKADSVNSKYDSLNNKDTGTGDRALSGPDADFAVKAANGGLAEVELGKLAQQKASHADVKEFGAMMVHDHSMANMELKELAKKRRISLPDSIGTDEQKLKTELAGKSGAEFDKAYVAAMVKDHQEDIKAFEDARKKVKYPEMTALIDKTLPVLKKHLQAIQKIQQQVY
jgi:putative membrane protein